MPLMSCVFLIPKTSYMLIIIVQVLDNWINPLMIPF